ncbi:helix-turn-helix transcriptional regulator [Streptomyces sp. HNM0645]|uniref:helix-turn-helix domain-containing protein n=1 Tax=Streptomyces sp. HNM0645 TaxID=2782343 RepID=UPI0024B7A16C|nr:helix-turn-helix transcriptional regulator [Streptomyces sp. HNM0645]MDI9887310.1 helix-turn-helix transcriptional regulator [Streptomyces sp. HNM0645]
MKPDGPAIRRIRRAQMMSLRSLQALTGLNRGYLSRIERGLIHDAADHRVRAIANALQVKPAAITQEEKT